MVENTGLLHKFSFFVPLEDNSRTDLKESGCFVSEMTGFEISPFHAGAARLITAQSHLLDRFVPDCEEIHLPPKTVRGGLLQYKLGAFEAAEERRPTKLLSRFRTGHQHVNDGLLIDLRRHMPQNFAHFLNNHLPIVFFLCDTLELDWSEVVLLLPQDMPGYTIGAAALFGFRTLCSNDRITGRGVLFEVTPWTAIRPERVKWARLPIVTARLEVQIVPGRPLPRKVFLSRRKTRTIANETEVDAVLQDRGYQKIYPEDLQLPDQLRLFREAEEIVAVHGAGLAPLLYVPPGGSLRRLIEILPCGHMTDVYRIMAEQVCCGWIGVRGRIKPEYVNPAYDLKAEFKAFSLDSFEVDLTALMRAIDLV